MDKEQRQQIWMERIADYRASGLTMAAWCESRQQSFHKLKYWVKKLDPKKQLSSSTSSSWLPVSLEPTSHEPASQILIRVGRACIEVQPGFDPKLLSQVVRTLETSC